MHWLRGESGEVFFVADIEELEVMDASKLRARRLNAKEVLTSKKGENHFPNRRWNSKIVGKRS